MNTLVLSFGAIFGYIASAILSAKTPIGSREQVNQKNTLIALTIIALICHSVAIYSETVGTGGFNLGVFNAASLVALCIASCLTLIILWKPLSSLGIVIYPLAALFVALAQWLPSKHVLGGQVPVIIQLHIALSITAYSLFAIASIQAIYLAVAHHRLKSHRPILHFLPPLPTMESILFQLTAIAFLLLSASLVLGGIAIDDVANQHLAHKIVFSVLAWLVFATLIIGRRFFHWRGTRAVKYVCAGFILLALAFFGTKVVLELILQRG